MSDTGAMGEQYPEAYRLMLGFYCDTAYYNSAPECRPADNVLMAIQYALDKRSPTNAGEDEWSARLDWDGSAQQAQDAYDNLAHSDETAKLIPNDAGDSLARILAASLPTDIDWQLIRQAGRAAADVLAKEPSNE